jgi:uncharacterized protein YcbX
MFSRAPLGRVERLWRYPVKSLAAEPLDRAQLDARGFVGDRATGLFVATPTHARHEKTYRGKEHERLHTVATPSSASELAAGRGLALDVRGDGPYFDAAPVSLVFDSWLAKLETLVHEAIDPLRFRANIYARAAAGFGASEADLVGTTFAIGDVRLRCTATITRCVTPTYDIATGARDVEIARALAGELGNIMGVYCEVERPGEIAVHETIAIA